MIVVLDANVVLVDPRFRSPGWDVVKESIADSKMRVILPLVALEEVVASYTKQRVEVASGLRKAARQASAPAKSEVEKAIEITGEEVDGYREDLNGRLKDIGIEILGVPEGWSHDDVASRAILRIPPFDENGGGYRDTLHWLLLLSLIEDDPDEEFVIVTDDRAFIQSDGATLRLELAEEAGAMFGLGSVTLRRSTSEIPTPGKYRGEAHQTSDFDDQVEQLVLDAVATGRWGSGLKPEDFDAGEADSIRLTDIANMSALRVESQLLTETRELELRFVVEAEGAFVLSGLVGEADEEQDLLTSVATKKIRFRGVTTVDSLDQLRQPERIDLELSPFDYSKNFAKGIAGIQQALQQMNAQVNASMSPAVLDKINRALRAGLNPSEGNQ